MLKNHESALYISRQVRRGPKVVPVRSHKFDLLILLLGSEQIAIVNIKFFVKLLKIIDTKSDIFHHH